ARAAGRRAREPGGDPLAQPGDAGQHFGAGDDRHGLAADIAARDGDWKYLKILDNPFLFDVAQDPMERANLKERHKDVYERLVAQWHEWDATMLPLDAESNTHGFTGAELADHFGVKPPHRVESIAPGARSGG